MNFNASCLVVFYIPRTAIPPPNNGSFLRVDATQSLAVGDLASQKPNLWHMNVKLVNKQEHIFMMRRDYLRSGEIPCGDS